MTDKTIQCIIDAFNSPVPDIFITHQPISANVSYALVWNDLDFHDLASVSPYSFYFILNEEGKAVAAVLDMTADLHSYVQPAFRKQGFLTKAMKSAILPHLSRKRRSQRVSITRSEIGDDNFEASLSVSRKCGFRVKGGIHDKTILTQGLNKYRTVPFAPKPAGMTYDEMAELRKDINVLAGRLAQIQATVQMRLGGSAYSRELNRLVLKLTDYRVYKLDDALYEFDEAQKRRPGHRS